MFWDASALVARLLVEKPFQSLEHLAKREARIVMWWGSRVECAAALARVDRERRLPKVMLQDARRRLDDMVKDADIIEPSGALQDRAVRIVETHVLRAADGLQLAAALFWSEDKPEGSTFVCLDERLRAAASREGFTVLPD